MINIVFAFLTLYTSQNRMPDMIMK